MINNSLYLEVILRTKLFLETDSWLPSSAKMGNGDTIS
jgi:hypothetical protein